jgi:hypothetical protein
MKTIYLLILFTIALCAGFFIGRWSRTPMDDTSPDTISETNDVALEEYESLMAYLHHTKQKNALKELDQFMFNHRTLQENVELAETVRVLNGLRDGQTNNMVKYYEGHLDAEAVLFSDEYSALPARLQKQISLKPLRAALEYRTKYPFNDVDPFWAGKITNAFKILDSANQPTFTNSNTLQNR